ncbi:phage shock protein PspA [Abyssibacter sp.]|jgi:phage shock protein A|uniref:phage shock protein PspA n=1 Tax=Abyssibacter sp. TaxID=2320200 RepID=UPI000C3A0A20|nr:phage shock protein PspA [Abyssibacter sp.]MBB86405.1 phage shock protein PspA [Xanthomonadales bacterium]MCK5858681.1 phage shock protein PspA [Abyssibacter sp.]
MGIYSRLSDIINSNMHAMLDKAEDPEKLVRLIIQEMEDTLVEVRSTSVRTIARKKTLERKHSALNRDAAEWERKAELAIRHEREDLARAALLAKQRIVDVQNEISEELNALDTEQDKLDTDIAKLKSKLADAKARQKTIVLRKRSATTRVRVQQQVNSEKIDDAMVQFEAYERRIDSLEAEAESYDLGRQDLNDEFAELESSDQVEEELAALKARVRTPDAPSDK